MAVNVMTAQDVTKKVLNKEKLFILDVRNTEDFQDLENRRRKLRIYKYSLF